MKRREMRVQTMVALAGLAGMAGIVGADVAAYEGVILGQTQSMATLYGSLGFGGPRSPVPGSTYDARALLQDGASAFFIDDVPDTHTIGAVEGAGANFAGAAGDAFSIVSAVTDLGGGVDLVQVEMANFSAGGALSAWQPTPGLLSPNGVPFTSWRMDVGAVAAGTNAIDWDMDVVVLSAGMTAFDSTGTAIGTFAMTADFTAGDQIAGLGVIGLGGADIGGFDFASFQLFWEVTKVPAPGTVTLLGACGLIAMRRRR